MNGHPDLQANCNCMGRGKLFVAQMLLAVLALCATVRGEERVVMTDSVKPLPVAAASKTALTAADNESTMEFLISLKMRNVAALQAQIASGVILPPEEVVAKYHPTEADYKIVVDWLTAQGFTITLSDPNRLGVFASGPISLIQEALQVSFAQVTVDGKKYTSASTAPSLPASVANVVVGVNGLQPHIRRHVHSRVVKGQKNKMFGNHPPYVPSEIMKAYSGSNLSLTGAGQTIGIIMDQPPLLTDLSLFWSATGTPQSLSNFKLIQVGVSGTLDTGPDATVEAALDVEWASSVAPNARIRFYATIDLADINLVKAYQKVISDLPTQPTMKQISMSYGSDETKTPNAQMISESAYFASMAAAGVTAFASTGDNGSTPDGTTQISTPSNDPSVTAVGGTSITLNANGLVASESAWTGSGGGVSVCFPRPTWQTGIGVPSGTYRLNPDLSAPADGNTGAFVVQNGVGITVGGTSWASPTWAGFNALLNEARSKNGLPAIGLLGPKVYPLISSSSFRDINSGSNGVYSANGGFDLCTGIGVPRLGNMLSYLAEYGPNILVPAITSPLTASANQGVFFSYALSATGSTPISYVGYTLSGLPAGLSFVSITNTIEGIPTVMGTFPIGIIATNAAGSDSQTLILFVGPPIAPTITSPLTSNTSEGVGYSYQITSSGSVPATYTATGLPAGLSISGDTISGVSTVFGVFSITLTATNVAGSDSKTLILNIAFPNPPVINSSLSASGVKGSIFSYQITSIGLAPSYSVSGLPAGLSFTLDTISGTPVVGGLYFITLTASNVAGSDIQTLALTVGKAGTPNTTPVFVSPPSATPNPVQVGQPVTLLGVGFDADGDGLGYTWDFGDGTTGFGSNVSHIYTSSGSYIVKVTLYDGTSTNSDSVAFKVIPPPPPTQPLTLDKALIKFNFTKSAADSMTFSGALSVASGFSPGGKTLTVTTGTYKSQFVLTDKGVGTTGGDSIKISGKQKKNVYTANLVSFVYTVKAANVFSSLKSLGFTNADVFSGTVKVPVTIVLDNAPYAGTISVTYKAKLGRSGSAQ